MKIFLVDFFVDGHHIEYAAHLGRYLLEQGHEVSFATWQADHRLKSLSVMGLKLCYVGETVTRGRDTLHMIPQFHRAFRNCFRIATGNGAAIIHILDIDRAILLPLWCNVILRDFCVPILGTLHAPYHFVDHPHLSAPEKLYHHVVRKTLSSLLTRGKLASLFVHTQHIKEMIVRALKTERIGERIGVVPNPLPDLIYSPHQRPSKNGCRAALGIPNDRVVLLFFGQLREEKGPDILLEAVRSCPPEVLVLFAGASSGSFAVRDWEKDVKRLGLTGRARFDLGYVPDELVPVYFQAADAVVLPYRRGFLAVSGVLQWAAGARKPLIAADVGELGELVKRNGLGLVVEPENCQQLAGAISRFVRQRKTIETAVAACAGRYNTRNHWRRTGERVLAAYESAIST
jgi:glycosyltransferase involved in cell wall biosynthesis